MLLRIVAVFTLVSALGGLLRVMLASRRQSNAAVPDAKLLQKTRKQRLRGRIVFWLSTSAFLFLVTGYATPVEILLALAFCLAVIVPLTLIKGEPRLSSAGNGFSGPAIARDAATGERLGSVVGQLKEPQSDLVSRYKIKTKDGKVIEKAANTVVIEFQ